MGRLAPGTSQSKDAVNTDFEKHPRQILKLAQPLKPLIQRAIEFLAQEPHTGKRLERDLAGHLSLQAKRYRVIYRVDENARTVEIYYVGHRRDIYEVLANAIQRQKNRP
jgi:mRNA-degrading endonuclease RelE of RelBE toxin-antitoxin system